MRKQIIRWMDRQIWHLRFPRTYKFWAWVVMPEKNGAIGFWNWLRWAIQK